MKTFTLAVLAAALFTAPAFAQQAPPQGPPPTPNAQMRQQFEAMHAQMEQLHRDARSQMLAALTPAHRQLLATLAGELAVASNPNYDAAAKKLDAALSAHEKTAIDNASKSLMAKMRANMQSMHQQGMMGSPQNCQGQNCPMHGSMQGGMMGGPMHGGHMGMHWNMSAGETLLHMSMGMGTMNMMYVRQP